ncbi:MAG: hypothetical protein GY714_09735 [Desulfobacterales bacterium]|nr:hypothetical protein [Desulfobacterales bacterium]
MEKLKIEDAILMSLERLNQSVITEYQFGQIIYELYEKKTYEKRSIDLRKTKADYQTFRRNLNNTIQRGFLTPLKNISRVYKIFDRSFLQEEEVVCSIDPFSYISHLSAMQYHGITDRLPTVIFYSSLKRKLWKEYARKREIKDFNNYRSEEIPTFTNVTIKKFNKKNISKIEVNNYLGSFIKVEDKKLRVSTIGRTFHDMIKKPIFCGGINHVVEVFQEYAEIYVDLIVNEIENKGNKIDKVRTGYILDEICNLEHPMINNWTKHAQRGGSRKLDVATEYRPVFSEKWCLSINVDLEI